MDILGLSGVNLNQHQTGTEDGEGMKPSADTGVDGEEKKPTLWLMPIAWVGNWCFKSCFNPS